MTVLVRVDTMLSAGQIKREQFSRLLLFIVIFVGLSVFLQRRGIRINIDVNPTTPDPNVLPHRRQDVLDTILVLKNNMIILQHVFNGNAVALQDAAVSMPLSGTALAGVEADALLLTLQGTTERIRTALSVLVVPHRAATTATSLRSQQSRSAAFAPIFPNVKFMAATDASNQSNLYAIHIRRRFEREVHGARLGEYRDSHLTLGAWSTMTWKNASGDYHLHSSRKHNELLQGTFSPPRIIHLSLFDAYRHHTCIQPGEKKMIFFRYEPCKFTRPNQEAELLPTGQIRFFHTVVNNDLCMAISGASAKLNDVKKDWRANHAPCNSSDPTQLWDHVVDKFNANQTMIYGQLRHRYSGRCLELVPLATDVIGRTNTRINLGVLPCTKSCAQLWLVAERGDTTYTPVKALNPIATDIFTRIHPKIRILCWIQTMPALHATLCTAINNTWGRDCSILVFVSTAPHDGLNIIVVDTGLPESRSTLWFKTMQAWLKVYERYIDAADWFFKADDDTYTNMHYMRKFVANKDANTPLSYGRALKVVGPRKNRSGVDDWDLPLTFLSGGSGQLLSRGAVRLMVESAVSDPSKVWQTIEGPSDVQTSYALHAVGVLPMEALDEDEDLRHRFIVLGLLLENTMTHQNYPKSWLWKYSNTSRDGPDCCSKKWIAAHYVQEEPMYYFYNTQQLGCQLNPLGSPFLALP